MRRTASLILSFLLSLAAGSCTDPSGPGVPRVYTAVATGAQHTCAVDADGQLWCWGRNADGQLGDGTTADADLPARVQSQLRFTDVTAGDAHSCALAEDGGVFCWGWHAYYQLGTAAAGDRTVPQPIASTERFRSISAGAHHTCGLTLDGRVLCWGYNRFGQNGNGRTVTTVPPEEIAGGLRAIAVTAGAYHTCAVAVGGAAWCWGSNDHAQLGVGLDSVIVRLPTPVATSLRFTALDAGEAHTCGIAARSAYCWGSATYGEIGDGAPFRPGLPGPAAPTKVLLLTDVVRISAGAHQSCAVADSGAACWGHGTAGQLGNGNTKDSSVPEDVFLKPRSPMRFDPLAAGGGTHACGIEEGTLYCWGTGAFGQLGAGVETFSVLPQRVGER